MPVVECENGGKPGYQWRPADGEPGECYVYDPASDDEKRSALRAAARDGAHQEADRLGLADAGGDT